jgi:hypothetical protein
MPLSFSKPRMLLYPTKYIPNVSKVTPMRMTNLFGSLSVNLYTKGLSAAYNKLGIQKESAIKFGVYPNIYRCRLKLGAKKLIDPVTTLWLAMANINLTFINSLNFEIGS